MHVSAAALAERSSSQQRQSKHYCRRAKHRPRDARM
jgi:hypothetical protein